MTTLAVKIDIPEATGIRVTDDALIADFADGRAISVPLAWYPRLVHGAPEERNNIILYKGGYIRWPDLDEDIRVESLLAGRRSRESEASLARWLAAKRAGRGLTLAELRRNEV